MGIGSAIQSVGGTLLSSDQVLRIACLDAETVYRDLSPYRILLSLEQDGWHVDFVVKNVVVNGGGPHYVIDPETGAITSRRHEQ